MFNFAARQPPFNPQAEQALLGALLANNKALDRVAEFLKPEHFGDPLHGRIYAVIMERVLAGRLVDAISLRALFEHDELMAAAGGVGYLAQLLGRMVGIINAGEYGRVIRDDWIRREFIHACEIGVNAAHGGGDDRATVPGILEEHEAALLRIAEGAGDETPAISFGDSVALQIKETEAAFQRDSPLAGPTTGYAALDRMLLGLQAGKLMLMAARPSMGKTAIGLGIAVRAAQNGVRTLFWSGEMSAPQLAARAAAAYCKLSTTAIFTARKWATPDDAMPGLHRLAQSDWDRLMEAERMARTLPLMFDTRPAITVQALRSRARRMKRQGGLGLLVIDYVGLMRASGAARSLYERTTEISAELMALKAELGVPVLALVQLNRANEAREDKVPVMSDLRDSGALEQDADVVMLLHRAHYYLSRAEPHRLASDTDEKFHNRVTQHAEAVEAERGRATIYIPKNRQGPTGLTRLRFHDETTWFRDEGEAPDAPAWSGRLV